MCEVTFTQQDLETRYRGYLNTLDTAFSPCKIIHTADVNVPVEFELFGDINTSVGISCKYPVNSSSPTIIYDKNFSFYKKYDNSAVFNCGILIIQDYDAGGLMDIENIA